MSERTEPDLAAAADAVELADGVIGTAVRRLAATGGPDANQVLAYDVAHAAAAAATARALLDYGAKGDVEARITCAYTADMVHDLVTRLAGREQSVGRRSRGRSARRPAARARTGIPTFLAALAETPGPRHLADDMEMVQDTFRSFADNVVAPHAEHVHRTNDDVPETIISGLGELGAFGLSVPAEYGGYSEGGDGRVPGDGHRDRGAEPGEPGDRRIVDHPPGDPHSSAGARRDRGAEEAVAAAARHRRGDGGGRRHGTRLRQRRRRRQGHRHPGRRSRRHTGLGHQRGEDVVHVRRSRRRAHAPRPHRPRPHQDPPRAQPVRRPEAAGRRPRVRVRRRRMARPAGPAS